MELSNKFIVRKIVKTRANIFKDLKVGDIITISIKLVQLRSCGTSNSGPKAMRINISGTEIHVNSLEHAISIGFEFEKVDGREPEIKSFTDEEKQLITLFDKINWVTRDKGGLLCGFVGKPYKDLKRDIWETNDRYGHFYIERGFIYRRDKAIFKNLSFEDIKWKDEEPTSREEILRGGNKNGYVKH